MAKVSFNMDYIVRSNNVKGCFSAFGKDVEYIEMLVRNNKDNPNLLNEVYCQLWDGIWDEDVLGKFRGPVFAGCLFNYIELNNDPYELHKYHDRVYTQKAKSDIEFMEDSLHLMYSHWWKNQAIGSMKRAASEATGRKFND